MTLRPRIVAAIWRKEISETLRDRRTLFVMIVLPVLLYPLLIMAFSRLAESESEAALGKPSTVAVWGRLPEALAKELASRPHFALRPWLDAPRAVRTGLERGTLRRPATREAAHPGRRPRDADVAPPVEETPNAVSEAARQVVASRTADAVLVLWTDGGAASVYFDSVRDESGLAAERLNRALGAYRALLAPPPFEHAMRDVAPPSRQAGRIIGTMLPILLLTLCIVSGLYPAVDLTAGEKERGTMQTLMCAPVLPGEIIGGKFLAVWTLSLASAAANIISLATTITRALPVDGASIPASTYGLTGIILVPVTLLTAALFLALAVFAKDYKEGQSFLTPVYMAMAFPAMVTMLPTVELNAWTTFVPIVNIALLIKALLVSEVRLDLAFLTLTSSAMYAALALALAVRVFHREQVLLGGRESMRDLFGLRPRRARVPTPSLALVMYAVALVASFYGSLALETRGFMVTLLVMQFGFFLAPLLIITSWLRLDARETFALRAPRVVPFVAAAVLGATAWTFASGVILRLAPPPEALVRALERLLRLTDTGAPLWVVWLVVAITPAVCEEALFRGFIMRGLASMGAAPAILISALLFGIAHASIYRLLPTFFLGIVLGLVVWRTGSLFAGIVMHAINNGLLASIAERPALARTLGMHPGAETLPWPVTIAGSALALAALALVVFSSGGGTPVVRNRTKDRIGATPDAAVTG